MGNLAWICEGIRDSPVKSAMIIIDVGIVGGVKSAERFR